MTSHRVLALVGSLRADSVTRTIAEAAVEAAPNGAEVVIYDGLAEIPFYNEDIDVPGTIDSVERLRTAVEGADSVLLVTPEYNGSTPAVLKNAIDWLSRPFGAGAIKSKPFAVVSASPSGNAGKWAQEDTVKAAGVAGGAGVADAHLAIGATADKFGDKHPRENADVVQQLGAVVSGLVEAPAA